MGSASAVSITTQGVLRSLALGGVGLVAVRLIVAASGWADAAQPTHQVRHTPELVGLASYYTRESVLHEGNTGMTASGELYDESGMTCAMRRRDWNSRWRACGPAGCATVRLNDFGPSKAQSSKGVLIDLTPRAFKQACGALSQGLCSVQIYRLED